MARRRRRRAIIDAAYLIDTAARFAGAIVLDTIAFAVWNVGTRSPAALVADVAAARRDRRRLATGLLAFVTGAIFIAAGTLLLWPAAFALPDDFVWIEIFALLVALALEHLVGNDLRSLSRPRGA